MRFADAAERIDRAASFADLQDGAAPDEAFRRWARIVHPDAAGDGATAAFARLERLYHERPAFRGDIADLVARGDAELMKIPRRPADNDLMAAEAEALRRLREHGDPRYRPYAPRLVDSYLHEDAQRRRRHVNVLERLQGFVPLSAVRPNLDWRDAAWMWRRLLVGLGWAHRAGVVHGAVVEEHVLIHPAEHGLVLVDWCYSGGRARAVITHRAHAYPPETTTTGTTTPATDIHMAAGLMTRIIGPDMPHQLRRFADGCRYASPRMRPQDAWRLLGELDDLLGPRTFRPFTL